jgi:hypothetical protein
MSARVVCGFSKSARRTGRSLNIPWSTMSSVLCKLLGLCTNRIHRVQQLFDEYYVRVACQEFDCPPDKDDNCLKYLILSDGQTFVVIGNVNGSNCLAWDSVNSHVVCGIWKIGVSK